MNKYIKNIIEDYTYPIIKSLTYSNGDMLIFDGHKVNDNYILRILCKSSIDSYFQYNEESYISHFSVLTSEENSEYSIFAGEGSWGNDGIVFAMDKEYEKPLWFFFLDNSDPFVRIQFETADVIVIQSSSGLNIRIPIDSPENLKVISSSNIR